MMMSVMGAGRYRTERKSGSQPTFAVTPTSPQTLDLDQSFPVNHVACRGSKNGQFFNFSDRMCEECQPSPWAIAHCVISTALQSCERLDVARGQADGHAVLK
jgi:hypothetical protein